MDKKRKNVILGITIMCIAILLIIFFVWKTSDNNSNTVNTEKEDQNSTKTVEEIEINTPYCTLYYPAKWEEQLKVVKVEGDIYTVQFFGKVKGKKKQHLFDIAFGAEEGYTLGYLKVKDEELAVNVTSYEFKPGKDWEEDEINTIYGMTEDVNYIIDKLEDMDAFSI